MKERRTARPRPHEKRKFRLRKPFALKLVVVLVLLTVGSIYWQGSRDFAFSRKRLDELKNQSGVRFVRQLALFIPPFWLTKDKNGELVEADQAQLDSGRIEIEKKLRDLTLSEAGKEILDIVIFSAEKEGTFYASLSGAGSFAWRAGKEIPVRFARRAGVTIVEGEQDGKAVRSFTTDMRKEGRAVGRVTVYLSAEDLKAAEQRLRREAIRNGIVGFILAAAASLLLGAFLTRPIRTLAHDMRAVSTGDLSRRSAVRSADEIGDLARTFNHMVESLKEVQERRALQKAIEKELGIARRIQKDLLPERLPELKTWSVAARWTPAKEVGGDYYDFIELGGDRWGVTVADVSGKGVPASLIMSMTRCLLRLATRAGQGPQGTLALVDEVLAPDLKSGMFVSMVYLQITEGEGTVRLVRAGHNPPIVVRGRTRRLELCKTPGVALGLSTGFGRQAMDEAVLELETGDYLVLYSDGIVEAMNEQKKEYGTARLAKALEEGAELSPEELSEKIMKNLAQWRGRAPQSDDITLVILKRTA